MRLLRLLEAGEGTRPKRLSAVPRVITLYQKCASYGVADVLIRRLHFNDLVVLLLSMDIAAAREALRQRRRRTDPHGGEVRDLTPGDAVGFLKGGGRLG